MLMITEAGGLVTDLSGGEYQHKGHICVGTPKVHAALLEVIAAHLPGDLK
jgi:fructose-1,6-bisphosphatase/inositol monophosphatase family enzyme